MDFAHPLPIRSARSCAGSPIWSGACWLLDGTNPELEGVGAPLERKRPFAKENGETKFTGAMGSAHHRLRGFGGTADGTVWEIGLVSLPATVPGEDGIRFRPLVALVMDASGAVCAIAPGHPDRPLEAVKQAIAQARDHPQPPCEPGGPRRVVVDSARLLELVPKLLPRALVSKGATPRLAEAARSLRDHMAESDSNRGLEAMTTYFTEDVTPEVVRGFFEAVAALYDRRPWRRIPSDGHLLQVTCLPLGVPGWTCCVIGQNRESYGVIIFDSVRSRSARSGSSSRCSTSPTNTSWQWRRADAP